MVSHVNSALTDYPAGRQYAVVELSPPHGHGQPSTLQAVARSGAMDVSAARTSALHVTPTDVSDSSLPQVCSVTEAGYAVDIGW